MTKPANIADTIGNTDLLKIKKQLFYVAEKFRHRLC